MRPARLGLCLVGGGDSIFLILHSKGYAHFQWSGPPKFYIFLFTFQCLFGGLPGDPFGNHFCQFATPFLLQLRSQRGGQIPGNGPSLGLLATPLASRMNLLPNVCSKLLTKVKKHMQNITPQIQNITPEPRNE